MTATPNTWRRARGFLPLLGLAGALAVTACGDDDVVNPLPVVNVFTFHDTTFDFNTLSTFSMPDTVVHFLPVSGVPIDPSRAFDQVALDRVRSDFIARGYTEVDPATETPSFVVLVGATAHANFDAYVSYPWYGVWGFWPGWGWYAPGFDASWGITYPWYPVVGVTQYDVGTLVVNLIPTATIDSVNHNVSSAWVGVATGLLNTGVTSELISAAIDQMFIQSPYLTAPMPTLSNKR